MGLRIHVLEFNSLILDSARYSDEDRESEAEPHQQGHDGNADKDGEQSDDEDDLSSLYDFIEVCAPQGSNSGGGGEAGPSRPSASTGTRQTALALDDDYDDERVEEEDEEAAKIIRVDKAVRGRWRQARESGTRVGE